MKKRAGAYAAWALDLLVTGSICAAFGALTLPTALLLTDLAIALVRHGHGVVADLDLLALRYLGFHALSATAILGIVSGFGYAVWTGLSFDDRVR